MLLHTANIDIQSSVPGQYAVSVELTDKRSDGRIFCISWFALEESSYKVIEDGIGGGKER